MSMLGNTQYREVQKTAKIFLIKIAIQKLSTVTLKSLLRSTGHLKIVKY